MPPPHTHTHAHARSSTHHHTTPPRRTLPLLTRRTTERRASTLVRRRVGGWRTGSLVCRAVPVVVRETHPQEQEEGTTDPALSSLPEAQSGPPPPANEPNG